MKISHKIIEEAGKNIVYIYVMVEDIYEFGKENLGKGENSDFLTKLRKYINNNLENMKKAAAIIVINGVVVGTLTLSALYTSPQTQEQNQNNVGQVQIYEENTNKVETETIELKNNEEVKEQAKEENKKEPVKEVMTSNSNKTNVSKKPNKTTTTTTTTSKKPSATTTNTTKPSNSTSANKTETNTNSTSSTTTQTAPDTSSNNTNKTESSTTTNTSATTTKPSTNTNTSTTVNSGRTIKFNNGGVVTNIDLEEYVIGVVAAEMPASFNTEALKAQAVVARTYAMKKASQGITLVNSTSHQVYNSIDQMKAKWGSSYTTYYNKIKNAVNATKGEVLKYNGKYIDALYFSMSNGKTELPKYVWSTDYPYLQVVSSSWDKGLSSAKYTINMTYTKLSSKLGVTVDENSEIKELSRTAGDRVDTISIAGKTFTGVKVRSLLGLRSADFTIAKTSTGVSITTLGFGHGVGMSQYGANGAAKAGYTYKQILNHYYTSVSLVSL